MTAHPTHSDPDSASHHGSSSHGHGHDHDHHHLSPLRRVLALLRPDSFDIGIVILYAVGIGIFSLATPIAAMAVVNTVALLTLSQQVLVLSGALLLALLLAALLQLLQTITVEYIQQRVFVRVVDQLAYGLPRTNQKAFDEHHGPELVNRFFDVLTVQKASATLLLDGITIVLQTLIGLTLLAFYDTALLGYDLVLIACLLFMVFGLGRGAVRTAIRESYAKYAVVGWMEEVARHPVAFKLSGGSNYAKNHADSLALEYLQARQSHFRRVILQFGFALFLQAAANAGLLALGGYLVSQGQLTLGQLVAAEIVVTLVVATFTKFGKQFESYYDLLAAADKVGHLLDLPLERQSGVLAERDNSGASVVIRNLMYCYEPGHPVLRDLNLTLKPGERVAIMGPNGSGKTTLVDLIFGLRSPEQGHIEIDGMDVRDLQLQSLREQMAILKNIEVFEGTVLENIQLGRPYVSVMQVRQALERVGLLDTIMDLPEGLNTQLWTGGRPLSLGQTNRLMLARAIVGQPRLIVLDETLDYMDDEIREFVRPAVMGPEAKWTLLIVTHSLEVAGLCDRTITLPLTRHHRA